MIFGNESLQAACLNNIADVYFEKSEYEDARTYYEQALQLHEKFKRAQEIVENIHKSGKSRQNGRFDQAYSRSLQALELRRSIELDVRGAGIESYTLGVVPGLSRAARCRREIQTERPENLSGPQRQNLLHG